MDTFSAYIPIDRRQAMARGEELPDRVTGAALFADISGFTSLTETLVKEHNPKLGAEKLTDLLNRVYDALISQIHHYGGSVIGFSGDAITCWFDDNLSTNDTTQSALRATACALALQKAMESFATIEISASNSTSLTLKVAIAAGSARRFRVGDPKIQYIDVLVGAILDRMAVAEYHAQKGDVVVGPEVLDQLGEKLMVSGYRLDPRTGERFGVVSSLLVRADPILWPEQWEVEGLDESQTRSWLLPPIYERLKSGQGQFLAEFRPAAALFLRFGGLEYDQDETAADKLDAYIRWVQNTLAIYDGYLIQLTIGEKGSYLYAAFGAPIVHGDNATRAVAAALDLQSPPSELDFITEIQIGLSQGRMRVGAYGGSNRRTYGVLGDEVNIAARFMGLAEPGQILATPSIVEAASERYHFKYLREQTIKGIQKPLAISSVIRRRSPSQNRLSTTLTTSLVGREDELASIDQILQTVQSGQGQILRLEGSAGVGKSYLAAQFVEQAIKHGFQTAVGECQSISQNIPYYPWQQAFRTLFGLEDEPLEEKERVAWITRQIIQVKTTIEQTNPGWLIRLPLLGDLLKLPIPDNETTSVVDVKLRRELLFALVIDIILAWSSTQPLLLLFDDVHWMDETSQELALALARVIALRPVLLVMVHRPEDDEVLPDLNQLPYYHPMNLSELSLTDVVTLIENRLSGQISRLALQVIHARAQGNPFFTEELVDALREMGHFDQQADGIWTLSASMINTLRKANCLLNEDGEWVLAPDAPLETVDLGIPGTIQGIVLSRIDRLPESYNLTLKVASVIGRIFEVDLLIRSHPQQLQGEVVLAQLQTMAERDLIRLELSHPQLVYIFKHNITQEATYTTLLQSQQIELHQCVAGALEEWRPEAVERLAYHYHYCGVRDKTLFYLDKAARKTQQEYANETALNYYEQALALEERSECRQGQIQVLHILGRREAEKVALEALAINEEASSFDVAYLWGQYYEKLGNFPEAQAAAKQALETSQNENNRLNVIRCLTQLGLIARRQGEYEEAKSWYNKILTLSTDEETLTEQERPVLGQALNGLGVIYRQQGYFVESKAFHQRALTLNRTYGMLQGEAETLNHLGVTSFYLRDFTEALASHQQALKIRRTIGDRAGEGTSLFNLAMTKHDMGDYGQAQQYYSDALIIQQSIGNRWEEVNVWNSMGIVYQELGDLTKAQDCLNRGLTLAQAIGDEAGKAYLLSNLGLVARDQRDLAAAKKLLDEGLAIVKKQDDKYQVSYFLSYLSTVSLKAGHLEQAIDQAKTALTLRLALDMRLNTTDDLATLAEVYLTANDVAQALDYAEQALVILEECGGTGPEFPQRDYFICYQILVAAGQTKRARAALQSAYNLVMSRAEKINDPALRQSFLEQVTTNREIVAEAKQKLGDKPNTSPDAS